MAAAAAAAACCRRCGCLGERNKYERAAEVVRNAAEGREVSATTPSSLLAQRVYHHPAYVALVAGATLAAMLLATWEPPAMEGHGLGLPLSPAALAAVRVADAAFLLVVAADVCIVQQTYYGSAQWRRRGWTRIKLGLLCALVLNLALTVALPGVPYVARAARPVFLVERFRSVRRVAANVLRSIRSWTNVMILLTFHVLCFSVLGYALFAGVDGENCVPFQGVTVGFCSAFNPSVCRDYFNTLENTALQLFELLTMANYPNVAYGVWQCSRASALYFVAFVVLGVYMLLSLTLAVTVATFKELMAAEVVTKYERTFAGFDLAFAELTCGAAEPPPSGDKAADAGAAGAADAAAAAGQRLLRADFLRFFGVLRRDVDTDCAARFYEVFDATDSGTIDKLSFRRLMLNFAQLSVRRRGGGRPGRGLAVFRVRAWGATGDGNDADAAASGAASDAEEGDEDDEEDLLEVYVSERSGSGSPIAPASPRAASRPLDSMLKLGSSSRGPSGGASVVANPLAAGLVAASAAAARSPAAAPHSHDVSSGSSADDPPLTTPQWSPGSSSADSGRLLRVSSLMLPPRGGSTSTDSSSGSSSIATTASTSSNGGGGTIATASADVTNLASNGGGGASAPPPLGLFGAPHNSSGALLLQHSGGGGGNRLGSGQGPTAPAPSAFFARAWASLAWATTDTSHAEPPKEGDGEGEGEQHSQQQQRRRPLRSTGALAINSLPAMLFFDSVVVLNSAVVLLQLTNEGSAASGTGVWSAPVLTFARVTELVCLGVFVCEVVARAVLMGPRRYWRSSSFARLDTALVALAVIGTVAEAVGALPDALSAALSFIRVLRLVRLLRAVPQFGATLAGFGDILPYLAVYFAMLVCVFYGFAVVGMEAFAGKLDESNPDVEASSYGAADLWDLNFDGLADAYAVLFFLLVLNDWPLMMEGTTAAVGKGARVYFMVFWLVCTVQCLNVIVAFILDGHAAAIERRRLLTEARTAAVAAVSGSGRRLTNGKAAAAAAAMHGIDDFGGLLRRAGVDVSQWRIARRTQNFDVHDTMYRDHPSVQDVLRETLSAGNRSAPAASFGDGSAATAPSSA